LAIRKKTSKKKLSKDNPIEGTQPSDKLKQYTHNDKKRPYNPPVGLVTPQTDKDLPKKKYSYDPHLDPQLIWSGKKENTSFEVDTVSLHVHERIDPITIIENVMKKQKYQQETLFHYFELPENNLPNRQAIEFYKHDQNWSNRLVSGDSMLIMNSLIQKENMENKVQMIYIDPPYGIKYGSNFQPFVNKKIVKDGSDEDLTQEPEMIKAFRDTWELGIHSYLTYLRDRLLLSSKLLSNDGSIFVQISDENIHYVKILLDEIFGKENFVSLITFKKTNPLGTKGLGSVSDYLIWYTRDKNNYKFRRMLLKKNLGIGGISGYSWVELPSGERRRLTKEEFQNLEKLPDTWKIFAPTKLTAAGLTVSCVYSFEYEEKTHTPKPGSSWRTNPSGMNRLIELKRLIPIGNSIYQIMYFDDYPVTELTNLWADTRGEMDKHYVVQTATKVIERCLLMTTDPGDLVFDPTCGSGTTAYLAEKWGRRWITCDTSRVAITLAKQRLMTSEFDFYMLEHPNEGISSGFKYHKVPHVTLKSLAHDEPPLSEILFDLPYIDNKKIRISGPFTVEAVPSPIVKFVDNSESSSINIDISLSRSGETLRQDQWRDELLKTGIRGKGGQKIEFSRVEILSGTQWIHADAETKESDPKRAIISFGPDYTPLEQRQVANALEEAELLRPKPKIIIFAAFQFDPEAAKDIDEMNWPGVMLLKVQMNADLFTEDLKKKRSSSESFWLIGQPDVEIKKQKDGKYVVEVRGFDYYNTKTGEIESGDSSKIAVWELDTDYDGRSLYPNQVFFPMSGSIDGWSKLAKTLKAEIDEEKIEQYSGTVSLPFDLGINKKVAVKIIDDRGIESLRIIRVK
jgi:adenine-specific DNA-methyltransferase